MSRRNVTWLLQKAGSGALHRLSDGECQAPCRIDTGSLDVQQLLAVILVGFHITAAVFGMRAGSRIRFQEHDAELNTLGHLKPQALVPSYAFSCFHDTQPVWRVDGGFRKSQNT
ncbi:hypothetical protein WJX77_001420 [Trebouxia sp. C0004]